MDIKEHGYILIFRVIAACSSIVLIGLISTLWVREGWGSEWKRVQHASIQLVNESGDTFSYSPSVEQGTHLRQLVLTELGRTDRCITCHTGIEDPRFITARQPYRHHGGDYLAWHPVEQYGCTVCHGGQGRAVTIHEAFGKEPAANWNTPLLEYPYIQASCGKCHAVIFSPRQMLLGTGVFIQGQAIFNREGCLGCHKARGVGGTIGPDLTQQGEKTKHEYRFQNIKGEQTVSNWMKEHFKDPEMVSPGSRMLKIDLPEKDIEALVTFVMGLVKPAIPFNYISAATLDELKGIRSELTGRMVFDFCCSACHGKSGEGKDYASYKTGIPSIGNRDFVRVASEDFIRFTLVNGRGRRDMASWLPRYSGLFSSEIDSLVRRIREEKPVSTDYRSTAALQGSVVAGQVIFRNHCETCHGESGSGGLATGINNRDFIRIAGDRFIYQTIIAGRNNTAMPSWSHFDDRQMADLLAFIRSWGSYQASIPIMVSADRDITRGEQRFHYLCSRCHGLHGEGDTGPAILNSNFLSAAEDNYLYRTIAGGRSHTAMFGWSTPLTGDQQLGWEEIGDILAYMRSVHDKQWDYIYQGSNPGNKVSGSHVFRAHCAECHGRGGEGTAAPALNNQEFLNAATNGYILATVTLGREGTRMPSWGQQTVNRPALSVQDREDVAAFIRSFQKIKIRYRLD